MCQSCVLFPLHIIKLIIVNFLTKNSLPPAIISTKPLIFVEMVHTIKMELLKTEINSWHKQLEFSCYMSWECGLKWKIKCSSLLQYKLQQKEWTVFTLTQMVTHLSLNSTVLTIKIKPVKTFHTMFCPCCILDSRLHNAGSIGPPKLEQRSSICLYLGHSPFHAGSVALVYNPSTRHVSLKYHVVFDDEFTMVPYMEAGMISSHWSDLVLP